MVPPWTHTSPSFASPLLTVPFPPLPFLPPHLLLISSGPMYSGVPMRIVFMLEVCIQCLANPKSHSFTHGGLCESKRVLSSFRSLRRQAVKMGESRTWTQDRDFRTALCVFPLCPRSKASFPL